MTVNFGKIIVKFYVLIICFFYGSIFSGSVLGILGWYRPLGAILTTLGLTASLYLVFLRNSLDSLVEDIFQGENWGLPFKLDWVIYVGSILLIGGMFLFSLVFWPQTVAGNWFPWDAGVYHFPKAVELFRGGSINDMSISYSEYPVGYESLLALGLSMSRSDILFGSMHALIHLFFILSLWLLAVRFSRIPPSILLFLTTMMVKSGSIVKGLNIWQVFRLEIITVGKNDLFVAAAILSMLLFFPLDGNGKPKSKYFFPFSLASMLAISIKPNAIIVTVILWAAVVWSSIRQIKKNEETGGPDLRKWPLNFLLIAPGGLWVVRNLIFQGAVFSSDVLMGTASSILSNIRNPVFYSHIPGQLLLISGLVFAITILGFIKPKFFQWHAFFSVLLYLALLVTPHVIVFEYKETPVQFNPRFAEALIAYLFVILLVLLELPIHQILKWFYPNQFTRFLFLLCFVITVSGTLFAFRGTLRLRPENDIIRRDQYREAVGVDGYYSVYDFVQKNVRDSVVWVENGLHYYVYGRDYSNSVSRKTKPDYIVVIKTDWFGLGGFDAPRYFPENWRDIFEIVYEDSHGVVVKR